MDLCDTSAVVMSEAVTFWVTGHQRAGAEARIVA
jgi:hypothetical protein